MKLPRFWICFPALLSSAFPGEPTARLGQPVQVTAQPSWGITWPAVDGTPKTAYVHFFPDIAKFPDGNLIATYAQDADTRTGPDMLSGYQISRDGGVHWGRRYGILPVHNPMIFLPEDNDSLLALPSDLQNRAPGDDRNFVGPTFLFRHGGDSVLMDPEGMRILDWPWPVAEMPSFQLRENWVADITVVGTALKLGGSLYATAIAKPKGARFADSVLMKSRDGGRTWHYFSTIASPDPTAELKPGYAGPDETAVVQLASGELMAMVRVDSNETWKLRQTYSRDGGRTWSKPVPNDPYCVKPDLLRTAGGTVVLSTGRPGLGLWLATDPSARHWKQIDIVAHHNAWAPDPSYRITSFPGGPGGTSKLWRTTSYTAMVETSPNHILLIYDQSSAVQPPGEESASMREATRIFVLPIEINRS